MMNNGSRAAEKQIVHGATMAGEADVPVDKGRFQDEVGIEPIILRTPPGQPAEDRW